MSDGSPFAFQKSTVFEKVTKHRETVAEGNVIESLCWQGVWPLLIPKRYF
jgi:hypothetical protein